MQSSSDMNHSPNRWCPKIYRHVLVWTLGSWPHQEKAVIYLPSVTPVTLDQKLRSHVYSHPSSNFSFLVQINVWGITTLTDQWKKRKVYENDWLSLNSYFSRESHWRVVFRTMCSCSCVRQNSSEHFQNIFSPLWISDPYEKVTLNLKKLASTQRSFFSVQ